MANAAARLHDVLAEAQSLGVVVSGAWPEVLGAPFGSLDFGQRYAELWGLFGETLRIIDALPEGSRARYAKYADAWFRMIAGPAANWGSQILEVNEPALDQLGALGDLADTRLRGTAFVSAEQPDLSRLREQCEEWLVLVSAAEGLAEGVRDALGTQLRHLLWLVDNAGLFGASRVVHEAHAAEGALRAHEHQVSGPARVSWTKGAAALAACLALITGTLTGAVTPALEAATGAVREAADLKDAVEDVTGGTRKIVDGEVVPHELEAGPQDR